MNGQFEDCADVLPELDSDENSNEGKMDFISVCLTCIDIKVFSY